MNEHIAQANEINDSLLSMAGGAVSYGGAVFVERTAHDEADVHPVDTAADLSGLLMDALTTARDSLSRQYVEATPPNSVAQVGEIVLVARTNVAEEATGGFLREFMQVPDSLSPSGAALSLEPIDPRNDDSQVPPDGLVNYLGLLSFDQPTQEVLRSTDELWMLCWEQVVDVWTFLYGIYPNFALRDGSEPPGVGAVQ